MKKEEIKKIAISTIIFSILTSLFFYFYVRTGISFEAGFDVSKSMGIVNLRSVTNLAISAVFFSATLFSIIFFSRENTKKERAIIAIVGTLIAILVSLRYFTDPSIFIFMSFFYMLAFALISLKTHVKPKGVFQKLNIGWGSAKNIIFILAIGGFITGLTFTYSNLEEYQDLVKTSIIEMSLKGSEGLLPDGMELNEAAMEQSKAVMASMLENLAFFKTFLNNLPIIIGIITGGSILFIGGLIVPPITAFFCLFLRTEKEQESPVLKKK